MPRSVSVAFDWALIAVVLGFLTFILFSPTGRFVSGPVEHARQIVDMRDEGGLAAVQR